MAERVALAAGQQPSTFRQRVGDVFFDFLDRVGVDQRTLIHAGFDAVADFELFNRGHQFLRERVVHAVLHIQPVRAHAGLAGIAVLGGQRAAHCGIEIGVVEDDEGRVAAQFQ